MAGTNPRDHSTAREVSAREVTTEEVLAAATARRDHQRNTDYRRATRKAAIMRARREAAAFAGLEEEAIVNGDLDPRVLEIARMKEA